MDVLTVQIKDKVNAKKNFPRCEEKLGNSNKYEHTIS